MGWTIPTQEQADNYSEAYLEAERAYYEELETETNADRIRAMSDDELAEFLSPMAGCRRCPVGCNRYQNNCVDIWLDWLRQEVTD